MSARGRPARTGTAGAAAAFGTVIAPTDFSELGDAALPFALRLAADHQAGLILLHVLDAYPIPSPLYAHYYPMPTRSQQRRAERKARELLQARLLRGQPAHRRIQMLVVHGDPAGEILRVAEKSAAPVIVIASHGRTGLSRLALGSVAEKVVRASPCPVLVVRHA
jgi:universal stress protein A